MNAWADSGLDVALSSTTPAVCTVAGASVTLVSAGTCMIQADQAGNDLYDPASPETSSFQVSRVDQLISFDPLPNRTLAETRFTATATAESGLPVTFTASPPSVCTATGARGSTINLVGSGLCTVNADQSGSAVYQPAPRVSRPFAVWKASQTIAFGTLSNRPLGSGSFAVAATATSGLAVSFTASPPAVCSASGKYGATVALVGMGTCTVTSTQAGSTAYDPAAPVPQAFEVTKANQTISFSAIANKRLSQSPVAAKATASSGLTVTFTSTTPAVCSVTGSSITLHAPGTCTIRADQSGSATINPAPSVSRSFTVKA